MEGSGCLNRKKGGGGVSPEQWKLEVQEEHDGATNYIVADNSPTYICSAPEFSTLPALNVEVADDDELRAEGENGALPRTELFDIVCPEFTGKFRACTDFIGSVE